jgi:hypothetical protein
MNKEVRCMTIIRKRFIERDYLFKKIMLNSEAITESMANELLDDMKCPFADYTFYFIPIGAGWRTEIKDNDSGMLVSVANITGFANDFYIKQLIELTKNKLQQQIA